MDWTTIITTLIVAGFPAMVTLLTSHTSKKESQKQAKRSNILSLITMDKVNWQEGKFPVNQVLVHDLYDEYKSLGGNSFVVDVMDDYDDWLKEIEKKSKK